MPLKKSFSKTKEVCKVTFNFPADQADKVCVAGDFNGWDTASLPMKKDKAKKQFSATVELDQGRDYQFRYFVDDERWENDSEADGFAAGPYPGCENCVVKTHAQSKR